VLALLADDPCVMIASVAVDESHTDREDAGGLRRVAAPLGRRGGEIVDGLVADDPGFAARERCRRRERRWVGVAPEAGAGLLLDADMVCVLLRVTSRPIGKPRPIPAAARRTSTASARCSAGRRGRRASYQGESARLAAAVD
jgi:hypothetical protein